MKKRFSPFLTIPLAALLALTSVPLPALAVSPSEWKAGRIIDDNVFTNKNSMSVGSIQQFLNSKVPHCDTNGTQSYAGTTRAQYGASHGNPAPFTCLKDYYEIPKTQPGSGVPANNYGGQAIPSGAKSAAELIWQAAQDYNINPKVLLVTLHKEQGLVTDDWPWKRQFHYAMGSHCPDSTGCDPNYAGFSLQMREGAALFRGYLNNMDQSWWPYRKPFQHNNIAYSPNGSCGSSSVYIESRATAALYTYTPYQPNQASLNAGYGAGDSCSSHGNRNFWLYFNDWFGSTLGDPFLWSVTDLFILDQAKNVNMTTDYLHKGERLFAVVKGRNVGTETWYRDGVNPARLGTWRDRDHRSEYCDVLWLQMSSYCNRSAKMVEESVPTGGTFHYEMYIHAPNQGGQFREYFRPLLEGRAWMQNDTGFHIYVNSTDFYDWQWLYFDAWTNSSKTTRADMDNLARNQEVYIELKVKNKSASTWVNSGNSPTRLGMQNPHDHNSFLCTPSWISCNRAANISESSVSPGQNATFGFTIKVPGTTGQYREYMKPVTELKGWMRGSNHHIYMNVNH